jgi:hypothetical protein
MSSLCLPSRLARVKFPIQNGKSVLPGHMRIASELAHFGQTHKVVNWPQFSLVSWGLFFYWAALVAVN